MAYTKDFRSKILNTMTGQTGVNDLKVTHFALGDGSTEPTDSDTQLENELFRKSIGTQTVNEADLNTLLNIAANEANNFTIREIGIFANGTDTANSGLLISRTVFSTPLSKGPTASLNIARKDRMVI